MRYASVCTLVPQASDLGGKTGRNATARQSDATGSGTPSSKPTTTPEPFRLSGMDRHQKAQEELARKVRYVCNPAAGGCLPGYHGQGDTPRWGWLGTGYRRWIGWVHQRHLVVVLSGEALTGSLSVCAVM